MPEAGDSALVVAVPEAEALLAAVVERFPEAVRAVPAHVSVLYPFLPAADIDEGVTEALSELFAAQPVLPVTLADCWRQDGFVALQPAPATGLEELIAATRRRWPQLAPYGGRFGDHVAPHLTVALHTTAERAALVERELVPDWLPLEAELREAVLVTYDGRWTVRRRFRFGVGSVPLEA